MKKIELKSDLGYFDAVSDSRANLYNLEYFIHGSPLNHPPSPGYFLFRTFPVKPQSGHFVITLNTLSKAPFKVCISIFLGGLIGTEEATFEVQLNPDEVARKYVLPLIVKQSTDISLEFEVTEPTYTGIYYIEIFCTTAFSRALVTYDCTIIQ